MNFLKIIYGLTILLVFQLLGEITIGYFILPIPGAVIGMCYLFIGLILYGKIPNSLEQVASGLLSHLSLFFVPAGAGIIIYLHVLKNNWLPITGVLVFGTLITMVIIALVMQFCIIVFAKKTHSTDE